MKKNVLVLLNDLVSDYSFDIVEGIWNYFDDKDVNVILSNVKAAETIENDSEFPNMTGLELLKSKNIDAIIVLSAIFCSSISKKTLTSYLEKATCKNIVSISLPLDIKGTVATTTSSKEAYIDIVEHLYKEHGCKNFAYMSAGRTGSLEALERLESFKNALKKFNLPFDESLVYEGDFVYDHAYSALKEKLHAKEEVIFDAILCANDMMAFGCIDYLTSLGLTIPEDVKVVGYDDIPPARTAELSLSTVNQKIKKQGEIAAETALKLISGEKVEKIISVDTKAIFRNSCGCDDSEYQLQKKENLKNEKKTPNLEVQRAVESTQILQNTYFLLDHIQSEMKLTRLYKSFSSMLPLDIISGIAICLYDTPVVCIDKETYFVPNKAKVTYYFEKETCSEQIGVNFEFDPMKEILPPQFFGNKRGTFMLQPICFSNKQYGYFVAHVLSHTILLDTIYLKVFGAVIAQSCIFTKHLEESEALATENVKLQKKTTELVEKSTKDVLTGIFNRRGFLDAGQDAINLAVKLNTDGLVCFADMDNLKKMNDTYGHEMGDMAIRTQAEILQLVFRKNDVVGRLGGDEFAAVLPGLTVETFAKVKAKLDEMCKSVCEMKNLPFTISISTGVVPFDEHNADLQELLQMADKQQYVEKRQKHAGRS